MTNFAGIILTEEQVITILKHFVTYKGEISCELKEAVEKLGEHPFVKQYDWSTFLQGIPDVSNDLKVMVM